MKATTRKATPAQNKLPPISHQTTNATIAAGRMNRMILAMTTIMAMPMAMSRMSSSRSVSGMLKGNWKAKKIHHRINRGHGIYVFPEPERLELTLEKLRLRG